MSIYKGTEFIAGTPDISSIIAELLSAVYPVGSIYIGTQSTCPMAALISGSTWELVAENRALWGVDGTNANTTIAAGLPNITGAAKINGPWNAGTSEADAIQNNSAIWTPAENRNIPDGTSNSKSVIGINFNASYSNSIYGNSETVQPPAYVVNIWRRTA